MQRRLPNSFAAFPLAALMLLAVACGDAPAPAPASQDELSSPGRYEVATADVVLVDRDRPTKPNGSYAGAPERTLRTRIWYPVDPTAEAAADAQPAAAEPRPVASGGPFPLIGYAHGYLSSREESQELKSHLASHGYIVAAPEFPLSNGGAPGGATVGDIAQQPGDLAFVMGEVMRGARELAAFHGAVDASRQGVAGLSLGGGTVLIAAHHPTLHLTDIRAAVAFAPASCFFGRDLYAHRVPMLVVSGDADELVPFDAGPARAFAFSPGATTLVRLSGGNHMGFVGFDIPGVRNTDSVIGCPAVERGIAGSGGFASVVDDLTVGVGSGAVDLEACGEAGVCLEEFVQTMPASRQIELAKIATLAHFEARLRGRADAVRFLTQSFAAHNSDVEVSLKP